MSRYKTPAFKPLAKEQVLNLPWYDTTIATLRPPVRRLAELGMMMFWRAAGGILPLDQYSKPLFEPIADGHGALKLTATIADSTAKLPLRNVARRELWLGGLSAMAFAAGASAVITHPEASVSGDRRQGEAYFAIPSANRVGALSYLRMTGREIAFRDGLPVQTTISWENGTEDDWHTSVAVSVHQEQADLYIAGDISLMRLRDALRENRFRTFCLEGALFNKVGGASVESPKLHMEQFRHMGNVLLAAAHIQPVAGG